MGRSTELVLYQAEWCPYCAQVRAKLTELQLDYRTINVPRPHGERGEVEAISGQTYIPVLVDGATVLDDEDAIIPYLEENYRGPRA